MARKKYKLEVTKDYGGSDLTTNLILEMMRMINQGNVDKGVKVDSKKVTKWCMAYEVSAAPTQYIITNTLFAFLYMHDVSWLNCPLLKYNKHNVAVT